MRYIAEKSPVEHRVGSAFATLSVTVERFFAIVFPLKDFRCIKKWLLPFTAIFTVVYNIPKFFEVTTVTDPGTPSHRDPSAFGFLDVSSEIAHVETSYGPLGP